MKKYKILILAIIALILAFSCFTGFVSVPTVRAEYVDGIFPPFSSDNYYLILDFTDANIPLLETRDVYFHVENIGAFRVGDFPFNGYLYQLVLPKSMITSTFYYCYLGFTALETPISSIGLPSFGSVRYYDIDNNELSFPGTEVFPNYIALNIQSSISYIVVTVDNPYHTLRTQYNNLDISYRNQQQQLISETSRANQAEANYNNLLTQYNTLNTQYSTLQGDYEALENLYEEARDNADHYQGLLREANLEIDELSADNDRLQGIINNLPPTDLAFGWVGSAFATVDSILSIEIIPNLTIGSLVLIPLVLGVLFFVLRLVRGE